MTQKKIYFASDVHLGHPTVEKGRDREKLFVKWLDEIKDSTEALYLVGDIFDFWHEYKKVVPRGFVRTLGKLAEFTDAGIPVHFFTGNHDIWVYDYLPTEVGVILHRGPIEIELLGKQFYIAHGDGLGPGDKAYKLMKWGFTNKFFQWCYSRLHPNFALWIAHSWSQSSRESKGIVPETYNQNGNELIYLHAEAVQKSKHHDYYVFGHRHVKINKAIDDKSTFIILGDWLVNFSYGVFDGEKFEVKSIATK